MVKNILSTVTEEWRKPDKGIWEIRGRSRQFVSSKVMCWVALDRGAKVADLLGISQSYISRLEKKIIKRLKKDIERSC